jgi:hypothetical protein
LYQIAYSFVKRTVKFLIKYNFSLLISRQFLKNVSAFIPNCNKLNKTNPARWQIIKTIPKFYKTFQITESLLPHLTTVEGRHLHVAPSAAAQKGRDAKECEADHAEDQQRKCQADLEAAGKADAQLAWAAL